METSCMEPTTCGPTIPFIRTGLALRNLHLDVGTRHTQAHRCLENWVAGDGLKPSKGETKSPVKESMRIPLGNWNCVSKTVSTKQPPRADRPACGTLSCDQRRDGQKQSNKAEAIQNRGSFEIATKCLLYLILLYWSVQHPYRAKHQQNASHCTSSRTSISAIKETRSEFLAMIASRSAAWFNTKWSQKTKPQQRIRLVWSKQSYMKKKHKKHTACLCSQISLPRSYQLALVHDRILHQIPGWRRWRNCDLDVEAWSSNVWIS